MADLHGAILYGIEAGKKVDKNEKDDEKKKNDDGASKINSKEKKEDSKNLLIQE